MVLTLMWCVGYAERRAAAQAAAVPGRDDARAARLPEPGGRADGGRLLEPGARPRPQQPPAHHTGDKEPKQVFPHLLMFQLFMK